MAVGRHQRMHVSVVAFADGSVQEVRQASFSDLRWNP
jgi:prepilin-type processing-associated H-X9-DG protein